METTVEEKHARVSVGRKSHNNAAVRVSLANRLPMLERQLSAEKLDPLRLLQCFQEARSLKNCPALLGIEGHPGLANLKGIKPAKLRRPLCDVIYRCDLEGLYRSTKDASKYNDDSKKKRKKMDAALMGIGGCGAPSYEKIMLESMRQHLIARGMDGNIMIRARAGALDMTALDAHLNQVRTLQSTEINCCESYHAGACPFVLGGPIIAISIIL